jgi:hypothetical protein
LTAFDRTNSAYGLAVHSLAARGGIVPRQYFDIISGSPTRLKRHISSDRILEGLERVSMVTLGNSPAVGDCVWLRPSLSETDVSCGALKAQLTTDDIFLNGLADWLKKLGLVSYHKVAFRSGTYRPTFGQFGWDLTAPSYIHPLVRHGANQQPSPGFLVVDILLQSQVTHHQVGYFINKCQVMRSQQRTRPFMSILIAEGFTDTAFKVGKANGVLFTTPQLLFGRDVAVGLRMLTKTLVNAAAVAAQRPEVIADLFGKLARIEGAAQNLRGALFELIVGHCVKEREGNTIDIGIQVTDPVSGECAEVDVLRVKGKQEVCAYECRGHAPDVIVDNDTIKDWLERRIPRIRGWVVGERRFSGCKLLFEFWTTGTFAPEAIERLTQASQGTKKYAVAWKDGPAVFDYVRSIRSKRLVDVMKEQYMRHPLSDIEGEAKRTDSRERQSLMSALDCGGETVGGLPF